MRHRKKGKILGREKNQRKALLRSLAHSFLIKEKIRTTETKAKSLRPKVEKLISLARKDSIQNRRKIRRILDATTTIKLFKEIGPRYQNRPGGYTRIVKAHRRPGDAAKVAFIELVDK